MTAIQGRVLGIDFGYARIGTAISDPLRMLASGLETLNWNGEDLTWVWERLDQLVRQHGVKEIVVGTPKRTDGKAGGSSEIGAEEFAQRLEALTGLRVHRVDERFTTVIASRNLRESGSKKRRRDVIDQAAAEVILQDFLDRNR